MLVKNKGLSMTGGYNVERLSLFDSLIKKKQGAVNGKLWTLDPRCLRFKLGESVTELVVPYHMGGEDEAVIEDAVQSLAALLSKRFEITDLEPAEEPQQIFHVPVPLLKEKTFRTDIFISGSLEKKIATAILSKTPHIDTSILWNWLGTGGQGRKFTKWVSTMLEKALKDEARHGGEEKTSYLMLLVMLNAIRKKKNAIKGRRIRGLAYEKIDIVLGFTLFHTFREAMRDLLDRLRDSEASCYRPSTDALLASAVVPRAFLSIPSNILSSTLNPYGINHEVFDAISGLAPEPSDTPEGIAGFLDDALSRVRKSPETMEVITEHYGIVSFREAALKYLSEFDIPGSPAQDALYAIYNEDRLIKNFMSDDKSTAALCIALEDIKKRYAARDARRTEIITAFQEFVSRYRKPVFGGFLRGAKKEMEMEMEGVVPAIEGYYACLLDDNVETYEGLMRDCLVDRREEYEQNTLLEEYNRGRLYRFASDDRAILKTLTLEEEGQLFVDMKDFTRKTLKVREIAMAEFMKEHFYKPILSAASKYRIGTSIELDERGIRLTNLPGDAAIFSGGISYLVALAKDIQHIIFRYREQLFTKLPPRNDEEILEEVHKTFEARREALRMKRDELTRELESREPGVEHRLAALGEEEHRLENTYRDELENAIKGEFEAGLYLSYGAKAETIIIEPKDGFTGSVKVSIGEKINEASRGTYRNHLVRAKLELLLEKEKNRRRKKKLKYPFDIYIDRIYSIKMPPELDRAFEKLLMNRKSSSAQAMTQVMANEFFGDLKKIISGDPFSSLQVVSTNTDIYNKGEAISVDALHAYMKEAKGAKFFFRKSIAAVDLDPSIFDKFFFPSDTLEFWFGVQSVKSGERIEAFYKSGEVIFKGFEASTPMTIYEILNADGEFFKALVDRHFNAWYEEARKASLEESV